MRNVLATTLTVCLCLSPKWSMAALVDPFATARDVSPAAINIDGVALPCDPQPLPNSLTLEDMIERVLCHDPQTREAWAIAKAQAALVGVKQAAYLPKLNASSSISSGRSTTTYEQQDEYSSSGHKRQFDNRLNLSWVLFDFGQRETAVGNARQLLIAANANQNRQLQQTFELAAELYYDALAAQRSAVAASQVIALAAENLKAASAKFAAGAAAQSDRLQAQTAYSQASLAEVRAKGALRNSKGLIALRMGFSPNTDVQLSGNLERRPDTHFIKSIDELLELARQDHPSLIAAKAKVEAANALIDESRAAGRPTLSLVANIGDMQTHQVNGDNHARDNSLGLQLNIPLFEGFERNYQLRGAHAQREAREAELWNIEQQVSLELWSHYQTLNIETGALEKTTEWVDQAQQALQVEQGRYRSGVGSMIELLNALTAYATAEQQHISALNRWQVTRLKMAASLGHLGFWSL
ncbi:TolC family protein [Pseudomonas rossensis]|uniref:TolC family protein n=1 Tax=Pseudomonas rossensis TaxID=2305471 RepID=UPI003CD0C9BB